MKKNFNDKFIKFCSVLLLLMIILTPIAMPKYSYKEAGNIVFKDIKVEDNTAEFSGDIKRKTMLSKLVPSVFVREFYTIRINTREEDRYFYFNPVSGEYFEGRPPK